MANRAAQYVAKGNSTLVVNEVERYKPNQGELLVKVKAVATNPIDFKVPRYGLYIDKFPAILGADVAGVVEEVGEGVTEFKKGDRISAWTIPLFGDFRVGGFQEYAITAVPFTVHLPDSISFETAAASYGAPQGTAAAALYVTLGLPLPTSVERPALSNDAKIIFINGGASAVGIAAIQYAALSGLRSFVTASPKHTSLLTQLGASEVFDYKETWLEKAIKAADGKPISYFLDAVGNEDAIKQGIELLAGQGQLTSVVNHSIGQLDGKGAKLSFTMSSHIRQNPDLAKSWWSFLQKLVDANALVGPRPEVIGHGVEGIQKTLDYHASGQASASKPVNTF